VLTEQLVPEGNWFKAHAEHSRIDIQDSNHISWRYIMLVYCSLPMGEYNKITGVVRCGDKLCSAMLNNL